MAVVTGVFFNHMHQHPTHRRASGTRFIAPERVEIAARGDHGPGMRTLRAPGGKGLLHIGGIDLVKGAIGGLVGAIVRWRLLMSQRTTKPVPGDRPWHLRSRVMR